MPAPEIRSDGDDMEFSLEPLTYDGHFPDAECISPKLEDFVPSSVLDEISKRNEENKGSNHYKSLQIDFLGDSEPLGYNMKSLDEGYYSNWPYHATNATLVEGSSRVYAAHLEALPLPYQTVILKFGFNAEEREALKREVDFYHNELRRAQKVIVPFYIGYFGTTDRQDRVDCLVLRFVGVPICCTFQELPARER